MSGQAGLRAAGLTLLASGATAAVGVAFLVAMFAAFAIGARSAGLALGRINDVLVLVSYGLAVPGVLVVHTLLRQRSPVVRAVVTAIGLVALAAIVMLQALLVVEALTFEEQIGPVSVAMLVLGAWFVVTGYLCAADGTLPRGLRMGVLAATYIGYPLWAVWLGRRITPSGRAIDPLGLAASPDP